MVLVIYREDHRFLLDPMIPKPGCTFANYDLVLASQPYGARASRNSRRSASAPLALGLAPGGRLLAIHSLGKDPGWKLFSGVGPTTTPSFTTAISS